MSLIEFAPETVGLIFFFVLFVIAEFKEDAVYFWTCSFIGLPMSIYYLAYPNTVFDTFLGVGMLLISVYFVYLGLACTFKNKGSRT